MMGYGEEIKRAREEKGLTQAQLAAIVGSSAGTISMLEGDHRQGSEELRRRLHEHLGVAAEDAADGWRHFGAARAHQASLQSFHVARIAMSLVVEPNGDATMERRYEGVRPNPKGPPATQIVFRERPLGVKGEDPGDFSLSRPPVAHEFRSWSEREWQYHLLRFPKGWRAGQGELGFTHRCTLLGAYTPSRSEYLKRMRTEGIPADERSSFAYHMTYHCDVLSMKITFPPGYRPEQWGAWAWFTTIALALVSGNLMGRAVAKSHELMGEGNHATLKVIEPLTCYTYALVWQPPAEALTE